METMLKGDSGTPTHLRFIRSELAHPFHPVKMIPELGGCPIAA
jgi:hypothetical protein